MLQMSTKTWTAKMAQRMDMQHLAQHAQALGMIFSRKKKKTEGEKEEKERYRNKRREGKQ